MKTARYYILVMAIVCIAAYGGYLMGGNQRQRMLERKFELLNYSVWATEVNANLKLLDLVKAKKYQDVENYLEKFLDVRLASISLYDNFSNEYPDKDIFHAIESARKYREQSPSHKVNPELEARVARALKIRERSRL